MDWSTRFPDLCWFFVCEYLSISDIAQLSSTCRTLRHLLWSYQSSLWHHLIRINCCSSIFIQAILTLFNEDEDDDVVMIENEQFIKRLSSDANAFQHAFDQFLIVPCRSLRHSRYIRLTSARTSIRAFLAYQRCIYSRSIPLFTSYIRLSAKLFRVYYHRLDKTTRATPIGVLIYAYLTDRRRSVAVRNMVWEDDTMLPHDQMPVVIEEDGSVCVTACSPSPVRSHLTCFYLQSTPTWIDLLPGRYNLTCRIRLRRRPIDPDCNSCVEINRCLFQVTLVGDRVDPGACGRLLQRCWFEQQHSQHGDDKWFSTILVKDFVLYDISNVYLGFRVNENPPVFFTIWIDTFHLNFVGINSM